MYNIKKGIERGGMKFVGFASKFVLVYFNYIFLSRVIVYNVYILEIARFITIYFKVKFICFI